MSAFTLLVTAAAFRNSGALVEAPVRSAGGELLYPTRMGPLSASELAPWLAQADAVIASTDAYVADALDAAPRLRAVVRWGTGYESVDVAACTERGIVVCNTPGLNVEAVADHVFALMLSAARRLPHQFAVIRSGGWEEVRGVELWRKTLGLVGFGAIGRAVARRARGFDCRVLAYDPLVPPERLRELGAEPAPLDELFSHSDFVSLHASLTPETRGMVNEALLARMKPTAYLINASRGPLVEETALVRALEERRIAGAAIDVYTHEPLPPEHPLRHLPSCVATPHSAYNTEEACAAINRAVVEQALSALRGERPSCALNPEVFDLPHCRVRTPLLSA
ncbi:MAG: phosphoglycerate dehydrogenase [Armatimonadota bacterium]